MASCGVPYAGTSISKKKVLEDRGEGSKQRSGHAIARNIGRKIVQGVKNPIERRVQELKENLARLRFDSDVVCKDLCESCSRLPWAEIYAMRDEERPRSFRMARLPVASRFGACPSCRILAFNLPSLDVLYFRVVGTGYLQFRDKDDKYWLESSLVIWHDLRKVDGLFVGVSPVVDHGGYVNASEVKERIQECVSNHKQCRPQPCDTLRDLKVLDCFERSLVLAPENCQFVALSYVWGRPTEQTDAVGGPKFPELPDVLPRTVQDSIEATKMLGYRYLWVDRYCIDQHNPDDQKCQIGQMGTIYSSAQVTIIAAAGKDAMFGLAGISRRFCYHEFCSVTKDLNLLNATRSVTESVSASNWYSRAWTLQEGYLSRRRLFLVEHGLKYICDEDLLNENLDGVSITMELTASLPSKMDPWDRANHMMRQFAGRSLTYEEDALNAIIGALGTLEGVDHTQGVTIQRSNSSGASSVNMALNWYHDPPCSRRKEFPSWSPLGWKGQIDYLDFQTRISSGCSLDIWHDGAFRHVANVVGKLLEGHHTHKPSQEKFLQLKTTIVMLDFEYLHHEPGILDGFYVKVPYAPELDLFVLPFWDAEDIADMQEDSVQLPCAIVVRRRTLTQKIWRCEQESQILIMRQSGKHYERVGCFNLHWSHHNIYARSKQGQIFPLDFTYGNPLLEYGDGTFWKENGEERTFLLG